MSNYTPDIQALKNSAYMTILNEQRTDKDDNVAETEETDGHGLCKVEHPVVL